MRKAADHGEGGGLQQQTNEMIPAIPSSPKKASNSRAQGRRGKVCRECGGSFAVKRAGRDFCSVCCRQIFHNRKALRGALLYSIVMAMRFDRAAAIEAGAWSLLCRLAATFRAEDRLHRDGWISWETVADIKRRNPHLTSTLLGAARSKR
jgi:hypothetical protein